VAVIRAACAVAAVALAAASARAEEPGPAAGYFPAVREEIARLGVDAICDDVAGTCFFTRLRKDGAGFRLGVRCGTATRTVYVFIERFLEIENPEGPSPALARRLLDLNRQLVAGKFEWERESNTIRLTAVLSTDSNFDRKAFRSVVLGLWAAAERLWPELTALASAG
jgi:hypothetical protein